MGRIDDKRRTRKDGKDTKEPLSQIGNRNRDNNTFDIDEETIKDQQNKK